MDSIIPYFANPGQSVRLVVQTTNADGYREDGYVPVVNRIYLPDYSLAVGYPQQMTRRDTGLYTHGIIIPTGLTALGSFIADVYYERSDGEPVYQIFTINVARPFGNSSAAPI